MTTLQRGVRAAAGLGLGLLACGGPQALDRSSLDLRLSTAPIVSGHSRARCEVPGQTKNAGTFTLVGDQGGYVLVVHAVPYTGPGRYQLSAAVATLVYDTPAPQGPAPGAGAASPMKAKEQARGVHREWRGESGTMTVTSDAARLATGSVDLLLDRGDLHADFVCTIMPEAPRD